MPIISLTDSIRATLAYYDLLRYPLTLLELHRFLVLCDPATTIFAVKEAADSLVEKKTVEEYVGMYALSNVREKVETRLRKNTITIRKWKRARRAAKLIAFIPFVRMVAVCNDLALSFAHEESDIDLFIVSAPGRLWWVRFWSASLMQVLGLRPAKGRMRDSVCLSFYASEDALSMERYMLADANRIDIHFIQWLSHFYPLYDAGGVYEKFFKENTWLENVIPLRLSVIPHPYRIVQLPRILQLFKATGEWVFGATLGHGAQYLLKRLQLALLPDVLREKMNHDTSVVITDTGMKFHPRDNRATKRDAWYETVYAMGIFQK